METYGAAQSRPERHPQSRAVIALAVTLAVLITTWIVGAILLIRYAPHLGELPQTSPSSEAPSGD
jgi:hypothetical protein